MRRLMEWKTATNMLYFVAVESRSCQLKHKPFAKQLFSERIVVLSSTAYTSFLFMPLEQELLPQLHSHEAVS